ncbi:hypothetical protein GCM10009096_10480 [Parasphingorhabdus litoris]|uniref:Prohead serine protease domain-containing protein n=1 Tax=Parasphingorhabdus litoris TaxID=394733 RepID=A0ABN1AA62_9SPHN|nr:prohead protease/major capsid protein fusion protein [Parasphingorhabdus litoris]
MSGDTRNAALHIHAMDAISDTWLVQAGQDQETRKATLSAATYDAKSRTVDAVLSQGASVPRWGYIENLEISEQAIDLGRAKSLGVKLLDSHNQSSIDAVLGSITNCRIENGALIGTINFADTDAGRNAEGMVSRGELTGISIGYRVTQWKISKPSGDDPEIRTATGWELLEASLVSVPADPQAAVRSFSNHSQKSMEPNAMTHIISQTEDTTTTRFSSEQAIDFVSSAAPFGQNTRKKAEELVRKNSAGKVSIEAARQALMKFAGEEQNAATSGFRGSAGAVLTEPTYDNPSFLAQAMSDALYARMSGSEPAPEACEFMGLSVPQMAGEIISRRGHRDIHRMSATNIIAVAWEPDASRSHYPAGNHAVGTLPALLESSGNRFLQEKFAAFESPIKQVGRRQSAADFREITGIDLSGIGTLDELPENSEIKFGYFKSRKETYRVKTYAKRFGLSRQAIINDDLGAFADSMIALAKAGAEREALLMADLLNANPPMADSNPVFSTEHANLDASAGAPDIDRLSAARLALRSQTDQDGTPVNVQPRFILSGAKHETTIEKLVATTLHPEQVSSANPFAGRLVPLVDPRLDSDPWYVFGDPQMSTSLEYAYLNDEFAPKIEIKEAWDHLGTGYRAYHDFGCAFIDWRGAFKNPGV